MKTKSLLFLMLFLPLAISAQDLTMSFSSGDATPLDSVTAMNVRTGEMITFTGSETLTLKDVTGIDLINNKLDVLVFPNPNSGKSTIAVNIPESQDFVISVRNQLGQLICQSMESVQAGNQTFSLSLRSAGLYSVTIQHSKGLESRQIITIKNSSQGNEITFTGQTSFVIRHSSFKSGTEGNSLSFIMGDMIRYTCYGSIHTTIFQDTPREVKDYNYMVNFHPCVDSDGMIYPVVEIGEQVWMAKNLAYLPSVDPPTVGSNSEPHHYVYGYEGTSVSEAKATGNYQNYGVLYNGEASKISCPTGWHLPSDEEFQVLESFAGMNSDDLNVDGYRLSGNVGKELKSTSGWLDNGNGSDSYGFTNLPGGGRTYDNIFQKINTSGTFWSSTNAEENFVWYRQCENNSNGIDRGQATRTFGFAVRCLKDETSGNQPPTAVFTVTPEAGPNSTTFTFDASGCTDDNTAPEDLQVRWDFEYEYDDDWDTQFSTEKIATYLYYYQETYTVKMQVTDSDGLTSIASRTVVVNNFGTMIDDRDEQEYKTVVIGEQTWMAENLNFETEEGSYCYDDDEANCEVYGRLYPAATTLSDQGNGVDVCPLGWHVPSDDDWKVMESYLGMSADDLDKVGVRFSGSVGKKMKTREDWLENGTNSSGFSALPGGWYGHAIDPTSTDLDYEQGPGSTQGQGAIWPSSTPGDDGWIWERDILATGDGLQRGQLPVTWRFAVRCLKNE